MPTCHLLEGVFSLLVQASLGITALMTLVCKRYVERPQRPFRIFVYDASKQAIAALYAHGLNLLLAISLTHLLTQPDQKDECLWYFVNFCVDLLIGIPLNFIFLYAVDRIAIRKGWSSLVSGEYSSTTTFCNRSYVLQILVWMGIVTITKVFLFYCFIYPLSSQLESAAGTILKPVSHDPETELVVVMVLVPFSCNIIQFWVQDTFLKGNSNTHEYPRAIQDNFLRESRRELTYNNEITTL
jgi:hypothetical protein